MQHVAYLHVSSLGRGIMERLWNKRCIAMSMSMYKTTFFFECCHLALGEKEGDELKCHFDVAKIMKSTQF